MPSVPSMLRGISVLADRDPQARCDAAVALGKACSTSAGFYAHEAFDDDGFALKGLHAWDTSTW